MLARKAPNIAAHAGGTRGGPNMDMSPPQHTISGGTRRGPNMKDTLPTQSISEGWNRLCCIALCIHIVTLFILAIMIYERQELLDISFLHPANITPVENFSARSAYEPRPKILIVTEYYPLKNYDIHPKKIYFDKFIQQKRWWCKLQHRIGEVIVFSNDDNILKLSTKPMPCGLTIRWMFREIAPQAIKIASPIYDDCGRKNGRELKTGIARKLGQIWFNKFYLLKYAWSVFGNPYEFVVWNDFGKTNTELGSLPSREWVKNQIMDSVDSELQQSRIIFNHKYPANDVYSRNFNGRASSDASFISSMMVIRGKYVDSIVEKVAKAAEEVAKKSECFDEETVINYADKAGYINAIVYKF